MRNVYAFDFSPEGELFGFDSDMEWDWGTPWYRPTRIVHLVAGGDYGWRDGTRTWPDYYEDSLPPVVNVGIGSPTGVRFATGSCFPERLRRALFAMDWSYGRILAVHLQPDGSSYGATYEPFLRGTALNLTDMDFGPDGALYFITGGRGTQSGLYRVRPRAATVLAEPAGKRGEAKASTQTSSVWAEGADRRALLHQLERVEAGGGAAALETVWPHLGDPDRFIRFAARLALERQAPSTWKDRALGETNRMTAFTALLALARVGETTAQEALLNALSRFPLDQLADAEKLMKCRVLEVSLIRSARPGSATVPLLVEELQRQYPARSWPLNRELSRLLIYLDAPGAIGQTLALLARAATGEEQFHYVSQLRHVRGGWTLPQRRAFLELVVETATPCSVPLSCCGGLRRSAGVMSMAPGSDGGCENSGPMFLTLSPAERRPLAALIDVPFQRRCRCRRWRGRSFGNDPGGPVARRGTPGRRPRRRTGTAGRCGSVSELPPFWQRRRGGGPGIDRGRQQV
ncbi:MAG: hypothetical protein U1G07_26370 [Verrucomicrobiota bacterium]